MKDSLEPASILRGLRTRFVGRPLLYHPSLPSTMEEARGEAVKGAGEGTVVLAGEQTAARGRLGRAWLSPQGSLALSIVLRPDLDHLPGLVMVASLAVVNAVEAVTGLSPRIKWPNDVLIGSGKVCGILIESYLRGSAVDYAILGLGINVNLDPKALALPARPSFSPDPTSLSAELGREVPRGGLLRVLLEEVERLYLSLLAGEPLHIPWRERLETLGREVTVVAGEVEEKGTAEDVTADGSLLLRRADGTLARIVAGEVSLRSRS
ncbi:MAG: biotin--[acetyl-CoA-carboxylase] ligase [Dehalococcoidia bacterium]